MNDDEAQEMFQRIQESDLLYKPSLKECQRLIEISEITDDLLSTMAAWGEIQGLLCGHKEEMPTHRATPKTLLLFEKIRNDWKLVKKSLVRNPDRRHLQVLK